MVTVSFSFISVFIIARFVGQHQADRHLNVFLVRSSVRWFLAVVGLFVLFVQRRRQEATGLQQAFFSSFGFAFARHRRHQAARI